MILDFETGEEMKTKINIEINLSRLFFYPTYFLKVKGNYLIISENEKMFIFSLKDGNKIKQLEGHIGRINTICFSRKGDKIVSCGNDGSIIIWDWDVDLFFENEMLDKKFEEQMNEKNLKQINNNNEIEKNFEVDEIQKEQENYKDNKNIEEKNQKIFGKGNLAIVNPVPILKKNALLNISSFVTPFSCKNCSNYQNSKNCPSRLLNLFQENESISSLQKTDN